MPIGYIPVQDREKKYTPKKKGIGYVPVSERQGGSSIATPSVEAAVARVAPERKMPQLFGKDLVLTPENDTTLGTLKTSSKYLSSFGAGALSLLGTIGKAITKPVERGIDKLTGRPLDTEEEDPLDRVISKMREYGGESFTNDVFEAFGSSAPLLALGAVSGTVAAGATLGTKGAIGAVQSVPESFVEAKQTYDTIKASGGSKGKAVKNAMGTFVANEVLNTGSFLLGFGAKATTKTKDFLKEYFSEIGQEDLQQVFQNIFTKKPILSGLAETTAISAIVAAPAGYANITSKNYDKSPAEDPSAFLKGLADKGATIDQVADFISKTTGEPIQQVTQKLTSSLATNQELSDQYAKNQEEKMGNDIKTIATQVQNQNVPVVETKEKDQENILYHGTTSESAAKIRSEGFKKPSETGVKTPKADSELFGDAIFFTKDKNKAGAFGKDMARERGISTFGGENTEVIESTIENDAKIASIKDVEGGTLTSDNAQTFKNKIEKLKSQGFDGIEVTPGEFVIWNQNKVKIKKQATIRESQTVEEKAPEPTEIKSTQKGREEAATKPVEVPGALEGEKGEGRKSKRFQSLLARFNEEKRQELKDKGVEESSPEYKEVNMEEDTKRAQEFVDQNEKAAKEIAEGKQLPPEGILRENIASALMEKYLSEGNINAWRNLATAQSLRGTRYGQEIASFRGTKDPSSPQYWLDRVISERMQKPKNVWKYLYEKASGKSSKTDAREKIDFGAKIARTRMNRENLKIQEAQSLLDSILC